MLQLQTPTPLQTPTRWRGRSHRCTSRPASAGRVASSSFHLQMLKIVPRLDPLRASERRVVEVRPGGGDVTVLERHRRLDARIEAGIRLAWTKPFELIERFEYRLDVEHPVHFTPHAPIVGGDCCRVDAEIEERGVNRSAPLRLQLGLDARSPGTPEAAHERAVEEDELGQAAASVEVTERDGQACP